MTSKLSAIPFVVLLGLTAVTGPATAADTGPSSTPVSSAALINGQQARDAATAQRLVEAYWTPERMASAVQEPEPPVIEDPALEARDRPGNVGSPETPTRPTGPSTAAGATPAVPERAVNSSPGVGKIFFTKANGTNAVCSGSTINSESRNVVSTAAHCIHGGKNGQNHQNWVYVPLYDSGKAPLGIWPAKYLHATQGWTKHSYNWWDFAFVNVWPVDGVRLVEKTGGNGISFNQSKTIDVTVLAYPAEPPYNGKQQHFCLASLHWAAAGQVKVFCGFTGGASGGPMLQNYDNSLRFGFTNTVVAYQWKQRNYGPYFDSDVLNVFNKARNKA